MARIVLVLYLLLGAALPSWAAPLFVDAAGGEAGAGQQTVASDPTLSRTVPVVAYRSVLPGVVTDPLDRSAGHAMWDPLGGGCIDGGGADDPFPTGKGDVRPPPFCIPQPCARALTPEELSLLVIGRPLRSGEWNTYYTRYAEACRREAIWPGEQEVPEQLPPTPLVTLLQNPATEGSSVWTSRRGPGGPTSAGWRPPSLPPRRSASPVVEWVIVEPPLFERQPRPPRSELPPVFESPAPVPVPPMAPIFAGLLAAGVFCERRRRSGRN